MLKGFSHSLKAIANEAIATANELREAHNVRLLAGFF